MKKLQNIIIVLIVTMFFQVLTSPIVKSNNLIPDGFTYLDEAIPEIIIDLHYKGNNNFLWRPVKGYENARCILSKPATASLLKVQQELNKMGLGLKVYDAYRPQTAVNDFVEWAKDLKDNKMKKQYYPDILKENLFKDGYIADRSGHSRGSTIDLTIVGYNKKGKAIELNMGTKFDFFGKQ